MSNKVTPRVWMNPMPRTYIRTGATVTCYHGENKLFSITVEAKDLNEYEKEQCAKKVMEDLFYGEYNGG